jgi:hypothetical protein
LSLEEMEQKHQMSVAGTKAELERLQWENQLQCDEYQRLEAEHHQRSSDTNSIYLRMDTLQVLT